jgi:hypothetical protein
MANYQESTRLPVDKKLYLGKYFSELTNLLMEEVGELTGMDLESMRTSFLKKQIKEKIPKLMCYGFCCHTGVIMLILREEFGTNHSKIKN